MTKPMTMTLHAHVYEDQTVEATARDENVVLKVAGGHGQTIFISLWHGAETIRETAKQLRAAADMIDAALATKDAEPVP